MRVRTTTQLSLDFTPRWYDCEHRYECYTHAYVPVGVYCTACDTLLYQFIPEPPEVAGYLTADWAWKLAGKKWTTERKK